MDRFSNLHYSIAIDLFCFIDFNLVIIKRYNLMLLIKYLSFNLTAIEIFKFNLVKYSFKSTFKDFVVKKTMGLTIVIIELFIIIIAVAVIWIELDHSVIGIFIINFEVKKYLSMRKTAKLIITVIVRNFKLKMLVK